MTNLWMEACVSFRSYVPKRLEIGMLFLHTRADGTPYVFKLERMPLNEEEFIKDVGYPVEPYIVDIGDVHKGEQEIVMAEPHQIGWWDDGDYTPDLFEITVDTWNTILEEYDGWVDVAMEEDEEYDVIPYLIKGKIVLRYVVEEGDDSPEDSSDNEEDQWHPDVIF